MRPLTLLAFDFGERRIGVAIGQTPGPVTRALATVQVIGGQPDWKRVAELVAQWQPERLIVGLPYNMDGTPSPMTSRARRFAAALEQRFGVAVELTDERLSSAAARADLTAQRRAGRRRRVRREEIDREAARLIAEQWLAAQPDRKP